MRDGNLVCAQIRSPGGQLPLRPRCASRVCCANNVRSHTTLHPRFRGGSVVAAWPQSASSTLRRFSSSQRTAVALREPTSSEQTRRCDTKESIRTSQAITPKAYISSTSVGCVDSVDFWKTDVFPRPAIQAAPSLSTRILA